MYNDWGWKPYVSVAERKRQAARALAKLQKKGQSFSPVAIQGRTIAKTFWGKAWCDNLERYSDFENRLPRGRTYARNGSVIDLQITGGEINALVSGSNIYTVTVTVAPVAKARWKSICADCAGAIDSLVELLQGRFSRAVMERMCQQKTGLFPSPNEIKLSCSCPDWADMCKHAAAVLYGIGTRLDRQPELLFRLNQVDENELIANAGAGLSLANRSLATNGTVATKLLDSGEDLSALFGLEIQQSTSATAEVSTSPPAPKSRVKKSQARKSQAKQAKKKSAAGKTAPGTRRENRARITKKRSRPSRSTS